MIDQRLLFFDLDDFLGDFSGWFENQFGQHPERTGNAELWEKLHGHPTFFVDMPPAPGALEFFDHFRHWRPIILTACSESHYIEGANQKREWVRRHLGSGVMVLPCRGGKFKQLFMHAPGDILVDDFERNIERWVAAGGDGVLHVPHDFQTTTERLEALLHQPIKHTGPRC